MVQEKRFDLNTIDMLLENHLPVALSKSNSKHIKLTTVEDIEIFKALLKAEKYNWLK